MESTLQRRKVFMVLSPRSLPYAQLALCSLLTNSAEELELALITDSASDKALLEDAVAPLLNDSVHTCNVHAEIELADAEAERFGRFANLRAFRHGHPCWRKITDPTLIAHAGEELILLDPDVYFPNLFSFEETPSSGVLLMWQKPNCLLPSSVVKRAIDCRIPLARHVDIGVSHWRLSDDLEELAWLDWLIGKLGGASLPRVMHVEAIIWAALAMQFGGGHLNPERWVCWHRTQSKRLRRKLGASGTNILGSEPWAQMKCFHAGGEAKWWLPEMITAQNQSVANSQLEASKILPFTALTPSHYAREQAAKNLAAGLGYYRLFGAGRP